MLIKSSKTLVDEAIKEIKTLKLEEVKELIDKKTCTLIDLRDIRELYNEGGIGGAIHIPRGMLEFWLDPKSSYYKQGKFEEQKKRDRQNFIALISKICQKSNFRANFKFF